MSEANSERDRTDQRLQLFRLAAENKHDGGSIYALVPKLQCTQKRKS